MTPLLAPVALLLLPGLLILRGPLWLALPASLAFWLAGWSVCALGLERTALLNGALTAAAGLTLIGIPRLGRDRALLTLGVSVLVGAVLLAGDSPGLPWSDTVAEQAAGARLLAWRDGIPVYRVPLGEGAFTWPGGIAPLVADLLLLTDLPLPTLLWLVVLLVLTAFVVVAGAPPDGAPARLRRVVVAAVCGLLLAAFDPAWLLATTLGLAAVRLMGERAGAPASFGVAVLLAGCAVVEPVIAVAAASLLAWRHRRAIAPAVVAALVLVAPLGVPRLPRWPAGHLQGPTADERRALLLVSQDAPALASVCGPPVRRPWVPALAGRRVGATCTPGLTSFHTVPPNPPPAKP